MGVRYLIVPPPAPVVEPLDIAKEAAKAVIEELSDRSMFEGIDDDLIPQIHAAIETRIRSTLIYATSPKREEAKRLLDQFEDSGVVSAHDLQALLRRIAGAS